MRLVKINEKKLALPRRFNKFSLRERLMNEDEEIDSEDEEEIDSEDDEEIDSEDDEEIDSEDDEVADDVTITLSPSDIAVLQKVLTRAAVCGKPDGEDEGEDETCPGCDDPDCPDCNPEGAEEAPVDDGVDAFEVPDVSGLADTREEDEINYFS